MHYSSNMPIEYRLNDAYRCEVCGYGGGYIVGETNNRYIIRCGECGHVAAIDKHDHVPNIEKASFQINFYTTPSELIY